MTGFFDSTQPILLLRQGRLVELVGLEPTTPKFSPIALPIELQLHMIVILIPQPKSQSLWQPVET